MVTRPNRRPHLVRDAELERRIEAFSLEAVTAPAPERRKREAMVGFNFRMSESDHSRLKARAEREGRSLQNLLNAIVWPALAEREKES